MTCRGDHTDVRTRAAVAASHPHEDVSYTDPSRANWISSLSAATVKLLTALRAGDPEVVREALRDGADVNAVNRAMSDRSPLHMACLLPRSDCLLEIVHHAQLPDVILDAHGDTPLIVCCRSVRTTAPVLLLLVSYGSHPLTFEPNPVTKDNFLHVLVANAGIHDAALVQLVTWALHSYDLRGLLLARSSPRCTVLDVAILQRPTCGSLHQVLLEFGARTCDEIDEAERCACASLERHAREELLDTEKRRIASQLYREKRDRRALQRWIRHRDARARVCSAEEDRRLAVYRKEDRAWEWLLRHSQRAKQCAERATEERCAEERRVLEEGRRKKGAITIFYAWRRSRQRRRVALQKREAHAALVIHRWWERQRAARRLYAMHRAAIQLQRTFRAARIMKETMSTLRYQRLVLSVAVARIAVNYRLAQRARLSNSRIVEWCTVAILALDGAAVVVQAFVRRLTQRLWFVRVRAAVVVIQRAWAVFRRRRVAQLTRELNNAVDAVRNVLMVVRLRVDCHRRLAELAEEVVHKSIRQLTRAVTRILWRENFCAVFRDIVFRQKRERQLLIQRACAKEEGAGSGEHHTHPAGNSTKLSQTHLWNLWSLFFERFILPGQGRTHLIRPRGRVEQLVRFFCLQEKLAKWTLLAQLIVCGVMLMTMGVVPRSSKTYGANVVDDIVIALLLVEQVVMPWTLWRLFDVAVLLSALFCVIFSEYAGVCVYTLLLVKIPFAVSLLAPWHSCTQTYCRAIEQSLYHLLILWPFGLAVIGATVRGCVKDHEILTSVGNWGSVLWMMASTLAPQYVMLSLTRETTPPSAPSILIEEAQVASSGLSRLGTGALPATMRMSESVHAVQLKDGPALLRIARTPVVQLSFFLIGMFAYIWAAILMGVHQAMRMHYDQSDDSRLRKNKKRFARMSTSEKHEARRAVNIKALERQLEGKVWDAHVRAAKEAIDASHYDHKAGATVHRFVRRVQDSMVAGVINPVAGNPQKSMFVQPIATDWGKWDCRNEDPESRSEYDIGIIEAALRLEERSSYLERFLRRQWRGVVYKRESNVFLLAVLTMAAVEPNLYPMEAVFSAVFLVELLASLKLLGLEYVLTHYVRLAIRLFCAIAGFVPQAAPFLSLRAIRFFEGWSTIVPFSGVLRWALVHNSVLFFIFWIVGFVATMQGAEDFSELATSTRGLCSSAGKCLGVYLRELVVPTWTPTHFDPGRVTPVAALVIVWFRFLFTPFLLCMTMHPSLELSAFAGRFLRLVVHSLHNDVMEYLHSYVEGREWFAHRRLRVELPTAIIARLKMWVYDSRRRYWFPRYTSHDESTDAPSTPSNYNLLDTGASFFLAPHVTFTSCTGYAGRLNGDSSPDIILSKAQFATFAENELYDDPKARQKDAVGRLKAVLRSKYLHLVSAMLTLLSLAFCWVEMSASSAVRGSHRSGTAIVGTTVHAVSVTLSILLVPRDASAVCTLVGVCGLLVALVTQYYSPKGSYSFLFSLRFLSLLRLTQLQLFFFQDIQRLTRAITKTLPRLWYPVFVAGGVCYLAELLRAQIVLVSQYNPPNGGESASDSYTTVNIPLPEELVMRPRSNSNYPNGADVRLLFAHFFQENAPIFFSIFTYWVVPACCIAAALAYLRWTGSILLDSRLLVVNSIPLLEEPVTMARFQLRRPLFRWLAHLLLVCNLVFTMVFSPSVGPSWGRNHYLFFAFETAFASMGLMDSFSRLVYAVHRCARSWAASKAFHVNPTAIISPREDTVLLLFESLHVLFWCTSLPVAASFLAEEDFALMSTEQYTSFFFTVRFALLLRMLPRQYLLALMQQWKALLLSASVMVVFLVGATSVLVDVCAAMGVDGCTVPSGIRVEPRAWSSALEELVRMLFTGALPVLSQPIWKPVNVTLLAIRMAARNATEATVTTDYESDLLLLLLAVVGRLLLATVAGVLIGVSFLPLRSFSEQRLPPKALLLYQLLCGGADAIVSYGAMLHDDMRPDDRREVQKRKFHRLFKGVGFPAWALPHLLEEVGICQPSRQRRLMHMIEHLMKFLPVAADRRACVRSYMKGWSTFCSGGPAAVRFDALPVYPPEESADHQQPPLEDIHEGGGAVWGCPVRYISALRLVQAIALIEYDFPTRSSVETKLWLDFFRISQRIHGATLMQSLWRMYSCIMRFETANAENHRVVAASRLLRRAFYRNRVIAKASFLAHKRYSEAVLFDRSCFNLGTGHFDVLNRLRENSGYLRNPMQRELVPPIIVEHEGCGSNCSSHGDTTATTTTSTVDHSGAGMTSGKMPWRSTT